MNVRQSLIIDLARDLRDTCERYGADPSPRNDHEVESAVVALLAAVDHEYPSTVGGSAKNNEGRRAGAGGLQALGQRRTRERDGVEGEGRTVQAPQAPTAHAAPSAQGTPPLAAAPAGANGSALSIREGIFALLADGRWWTTPELVDAIERGGRVRAKVNSMTVGTALAEAMRRGLVQRQALEVSRQGARFEWRAWPK
jgi:hypothetical protein